MKHYPSPRLREVCRHLPTPRLPVYYEALIHTINKAIFLKALPGRLRPGSL